MLKISVLQAATTCKLYRISMAWIVKSYQARSQYDCGDPCQRKNTAVMVKTLHQNGLHDISSVLYKVVSILATIPATSCTAERSSSTFRHIHDGTNRLSSITVINIERIHVFVY